MKESKFLYSPNDMVNRSPIPENWLSTVIKGEPEICEYIAQLAKSKIQLGKNRVYRIAIDAHLGVDWERLISNLDKILRWWNLKPSFFDISNCLKNDKVIEKIIQPYLPDDPIFGRIYEGELIDFFDKRKLDSLKKELQSIRQKYKEHFLSDVFVCCGSGSAMGDLRHLFDDIIYIDMTREEILKRFKNGIVKPLGSTGTTEKVPKKKSDDALPAYFSTRRLYYIDYPVLDKHRRQLLNRIDFYIDGNSINEPKMMPADVFHKILDLVSSGPIKPKPYYDPSPWGGFWLKRVRQLPKKMVNCAWSYDLIEPEASFLIDCANTYLEIPFSVLISMNPKKIMGSKGTKKVFQGQFPIRINYDDSYDGGDMALQCHPNSAYIKKHFNEPFRQDESYYVVDCRSGSRVYLGLKEDVNISKFRKAVIQAEKDKIPFDHNEFVNSIPSRTGDLFLIPAGTLHASGKNETVLEISATTYRYTFHFYDYLRPGLDGNLRSIHSKHAFNALKTYRKSLWVEENLKQRPRLLRKGKDWAEYLLGARKDMFFKVHRLEFDYSIRDNTQGEFHLLILVAGVRIKIKPFKMPQLETELPFSCLVLIPASLGEYMLEAVGGKSCKVVKVIMS